MATHEQRLRDRMVECDKVKVELQKEFDEKDWDYEFSQMNDDEDYDPVPKITERLSDKTIMEEVFKKMSAYERDQDLNNLYWEVFNKTQSVYQHFYNIYKKEVLKCEEELRPSYVVCDDCDFVSTSTTKARTHKCNINPEDAHKKENCRFACNKCKYYTNSSEYIKRHERSKDHLEKMGTPKQTQFYCSKCNKEHRFKSEMERHEKSCKEKQNYECIKCNRVFVFKSEYERHLTTLRHLK